MNSWSSLPLYWRVCYINAAVFVVGVIVLIVSPATVSPEVSMQELGVLAVGLLLILVCNAALLRASLAPVDEMITLMQQIDLEGPGQRLSETSGGSVRQLVVGFNTMVARLQLERAQSNARSLAAQEAERHRIAQELHDEIGQGLTVLLLGLSRVAAAAPAPLAGELEVLQESARTSLEEVREVARRLRPGVLEDLGLRSALAALTSDFTQHTGGTVTRSIAVDLPELSSAAELVIYRVAQEALTNVARHAAADTTELSLTETPTGVELSVLDNGRGAVDPLDGSGIRGMRERALLVGGELTVAPRPTGGIEVRLVIPVTSPVVL